MERFLYSVENTALCPSMLCYFCCFNIRQVFVYCQSLYRNENTLIEKICYWRYLSFDCSVSNIAFDFHRHTFSFQVQAESAANDWNEYRSTSLMLIFDMKIMMAAIIYSANAPKIDFRFPFCNRMYDPVWPHLSSENKMKIYIAKYRDYRPCLVNRIFPTCVYRISSSHKRSSCWCANWLDVIIVQDNSIFSEGIDVWSVYFWSVKSYIDPAEIIC